METVFRREGCFGSRSGCSGDYVSSYRHCEAHLLVSNCSLHCLSMAVGGDS